MTTVAQDNQATDRAASSDERLVRTASSNGVFFRRLIHDLRNFLAPMGNVAQLIRLQVGENANLVAATQLLDRQLGRMGRLFDRIAMAEQMFRDDQSASREHIGIERLLALIEEKAKDLLAVRRNHLSISCDRRDVTIVFNEAHLLAALTELLQNASNYAEVGAAIWLETGIDGDLLTVSIRDEGSGITVERLDKLLARSHGLDVVLAESSTGIGLGLAIAQRAMALGGGTLSARSTGLGCGSTFVLHLPLATVERDERAQMGRDKAQRVTAFNDVRTLDEIPQRVLVVDDNRTLQVALISVIEELGHRAKGVSSGEEGLAVALSWSPDLILLDLYLPGLNGLEVAKRFRQAFSDKLVTIVLMSGDEFNEAMRSAALAAGVDHCVGKLESGQLLENLLSPRRR